VRAVNAPPILEARDVAWRVGTETILDHVSLSLHEGEILTVIGPNGAGKTSLLRILMGLTEPSAGSVWREPGLRIGYMPQRLVIDPSLPLDVGRFLRLAERNPRRLEAVAEEVGIRELLRTPVASVSGGEFQRVLLARALLRAPRLLVLDEPVQGVDVNGQAELYGLINGVRRRHQCAVLMISHDLHLVMAATDTVLCLNRHVCCAGKPEVVSAHPEFLQLFGKQTIREIAVYTHHHDHEHDLHGHVVEPRRG
jgi:zinc transport system ATP-binding protein